MHPSVLPLTEETFVKFSVGTDDTEGGSRCLKGIQGLIGLTVIDYNKYHNYPISQVVVGRSSNESGHITVNTGVRASQVT